MRRGSAASCWLAALAGDKLMGRAGVDGFTLEHPRLIERQSNLLDHNSMFHADVITQLWLPFLELADKRRRQAEQQEAEAEQRGGG